MNYRNRVHPDLIEMYDSAPDMQFDDFPGYVRKMMEEEYDVAGPVSSENIEISEQGNLRIYQPVNNENKLPALLWIHGGGYIGGFAKKDDWLCIRFAEEAKCVVVSVDYQLAPESVFPTQIEECYYALQWLYDNAEDLNVDRGRIAVAGNSAGGGLTAGLTLLARDRGGPRIVFQMPLYPMIDDRCDSPSCVEMQDRKAWSGDSNKIAWAIYLGDSDVSPYAAAIRAEDFSNLPATYTCIGDLDPFRDEVIEYVAKLSREGVPVEFHLYPGCFHGFEVSPVRTEIGDIALSEYINALARALNPK